jgi:ornithine decarboxylase
MNLWQQQLPKIKPYYAVKSNPEKPLLERLAKLGAGFDCASGRELMEVASLGAPILYANPCKPERDVRLAKMLRCPTTVIDSAEEVDKLDYLEWEGSALLRIQVDDKGSLMPFSAKFGLPVEDVKKVAEHAQKKGLNLEGVSFHVGSGCQDAQQYKKAIAASQAAIHEMRGFGHTGTMIDIGGGFVPQHESFEKSARAIRVARGSLIELPNVTMVAEPGRFFAQPSLDLFVQVIGKKPALDGKGWRYTIDESLYGQFSSIPFDHYKPRWLRIPSLHKEDNKPRRTVQGSLFGRTCDSLDLIARSSAMEELEVGDWLWFPYMGAYTTVTASEFNGFPKPPMHGTAQSVYLPNPEDIGEAAWPQGVETVSHVKMPL